jgi:hypothetical protein
MTITASRLGSAPITVDWSNFANVPVASGTRGRPQESFGEGAKEECREAWTRLKTRFQTGEIGFYDAPINNDLSQAKESIELAAKYVSSGNSLTPFT